MGLLERIGTPKAVQAIRPAAARSITTVEDYVEALNSLQFDVLTNPGFQQTLGGQTAERIAHDLVGYTAQAFAANGPVFSVMLVRQLIFSAVRFRWQRLSDGAPTGMFGTPELGMLERPWVGGTTQDLLNRVIQYADLAGNSYLYPDTSYARLDGDGQAEIVPLRPDWVDIVLKPRKVRGGTIGWQKIGYLYTDGGQQSGDDPVALLPDEVSHYAPIPDPLARWRGMSWLTPVIREVRNDKLMQNHQQTFFENAATPNMVVKVDKGLPVEAFKKFVAVMKAEHDGPENAGKTLYLGGGADATVVGATFAEMAFTDLQGVAETRIASAGGVPPIIAGFVKGLESATYSNYGQARRRLADGTMHPLWQNVAGSLEPLLKRPDGPVRLWYDATNVPFLREDEKDAAEIQFRQSQTIRNLLDAGYKPDSVIAAVESNDWRKLVHTGLYSVQLQKPGTTITGKPANAGGSAQGNDSPGDSQGDQGGTTDE